MKKLLNILSIIILTSTTSGSVIACGSRKTPNTQKTDLNGLPNELDVVLSEKIITVVNYELSLIKLLNNHQEFNNLSLSDVDITKVDGSELSDDDLIQGKLNTKVAAKPTVTSFVGKKIIDVNITILTDLTDLPNNVAVTLKSSQQTVDSFKSIIMIELKKPQEFKNLSLSDVDITKVDGSELSDDDLIQGKLKTKVAAKPTATSFVGKKIIDVNITILTDLTDLPNNVAVTLKSSQQTVDSFKSIIMIKLKKPQEFKNLSLSDVDITKVDGSELSDDDLTQGQLKTKVTAKPTATSLVGKKIIDVNITILTDLNDLITNKNLGDIYGNFINPTENNIKNNLKRKFPNLETDHILVSNIIKDSATISGDNIKYFGSLTIEYTIINFEAMNGIDAVILALTTDKDGNVYAGGSGYKYNIYKSNGKDAFTAMNGISGDIHALVADKNGNVYAGSGNGTVYKCLAGQTEFKAMTGTTGIIRSLTTDKDDNVYAGSWNGVVYKSNGKDAFTAMTGTSGDIYALVADKNDNVYAGSGNGTVYKCLANQTQFKPSFITGISSIVSLTIDKNRNIYAGNYEGTIFKSEDGIKFHSIFSSTSIIRSLTTDKDDNVYAGSVNGSVYKCLAGQTEFKAMTGATNWIDALVADKDGNIYAGSEDNKVYKSQVQINT